MDSIFLYIIVAAITIPVYVLLARKANTEVKGDNVKTITLKMHIAYKYVGLLGIIAGLVAAVMCLIEVDEGEKLIAATVFLLFFEPLGITCYLWWRNHSVIISDESIQATSVYGKITKLNWTDINSISFGGTSGLLTFKDESDTIVKSHQHLVGFKHVIDSLNSKTEWDSKKLRLPY